MNIGARATRAALKDDARAKAERLSGSVSGLRYQQWKDGKGGEQVRTLSPWIFVGDFMRSRSWC